MKLIMRTFVAELCVNWKRGDSSAKPWTPPLLPYK